MSSGDQRHDYSLLGSFMPKDVPDPRPSIPVKLELGDEKLVEKKDAGGAGAPRPE